MGCEGYKMKPIPDKEELFVLYNTFGSSLSSVAKIYGTTHPTIRKWLNKYGIPLKDHLTASREANQKNQSGTQRISIEVQEKLNDREWLHQKRIVEKLSIEHIGQLLSVSIAPVN